MADLFTVTVTGGDRAMKVLGALAANVKDLRPFWRDEFAPKYFGIVQDLFETEGRARGAGGRFAGGAWAPLARWYAAWKRVNFPGTKILERTGALKDSVNWTGNGLGPGGIWDAQPKHVLFGTAIPYGIKHQEGDPTTNLPARPFLPAPDLTVFGPLLQNWIVRYGHP
jgi:phage gpG-like protein